MSNKEIIKENYKSMYEHWLENIGKDWTKKDSKEIEVKAGDEIYIFKFTTWRDGVKLELFGENIDNEEPKRLVSYSTSSDYKDYDAVINAMFEVINTRPGTEYYDGITCLSTNVVFNMNDYHLILKNLGFKANVEDWGLKENYENRLNYAFKLNKDKAFVLTYDKRSRGVRAYVAWSLYDVDSHSSNSGVVDFFELSTDRLVAIFNELHMGEYSFPIQLLTISNLKRKIKAYSIDTDIKFKNEEDLKTLVEEYNEIIMNYDDPQDFEIFINKFIANKFWFGHYMADGNKRMARILLEFLHRSITIGHIQ